MAAKKKKNVKAPGEILKAEHAQMVRGVFRGAGFTRISALCGKEFNYNNQKSDFDEVFVFENVLVCIELTTTSSEKVGDHLKPKKIVYDKIQNDEEAFVKFYCDLSVDLGKTLLGKYAASDVVVRVVYASRHDFQPHYKINVPNPIYLDYPVLRYFKSTVETIRISGRHELLQFLKVDDQKLGNDGAIDHGEKSDTYDGALLPEASSNFAPGYKVVTFYVDPQNLLTRAYVLRRNGWRQSFSLYQRLLSKEKIDGIRKYLRSEKRVFVNNVIATLPPDTKLIDPGTKKQVEAKDLKQTMQVKIQVPRRYNSVGIVDGQHRTYSYYETLEDDPEIAKLRKRQNLLVTGVIYPEGALALEREKFEARLFLEINANQTTAKSNLKQAIGLILDPFAAESVAAKVLDFLDRQHGPLANQVERYFFDVDKLKPTSIISYGLKPLVKLSGTDSLFHKWDHEGKDELPKGEDIALLDAYVAYCAAEINAILVGFRSGLPKGRWTTDKAVDGRALTTTFVNAMLIVLRMLIVQQKTTTQAGYVAKLKAIADFDASTYHSSQYGKMAAAIVDAYF